MKFANIVQKFIVVSIFFVSHAHVYAGSVDGNWLFHKEDADQLDRALAISGSSFISLITTEEGAAYESGWWTENPGTNGRTSVIVRYGDSPPDTIEYKLDNPNHGTIWFLPETTPWGTMSRINCNLIMQYRNKSDVPPAGCAWLHIRGWGYSGLEGECQFHEDWENLPPNDDPMDCLIEAPQDFVN